MVNSEAVNGEGKNSPKETRRRGRKPQSQGENYLTRGRSDNSKNPVACSEGLEVNLFREARRNGKEKQPQPNG